jgi:hypothetical protein
MFVSRFWQHYGGQRLGGVLGVMKLIGGANRGLQKKLLDIRPEDGSCNVKRNVGKLNIRRCSYLNTEGLH